jgi:hypothetical protein
MTETEWLTSTNYRAMLIYLRGEEFQAEQVRAWLHCEAGHLAEGEAERTSRRKLGLVAVGMCRRWYALPLDGGSRRCLKAYGRFANDEAALDEILLELPDTPLGIAHLGNALAWEVSDFVAKDSATKVWKNATEDERLEWGFFGIGPPDPLWQSTHKKVWDEYPLLLREIIGDPFRPASSYPAWLPRSRSTVTRIAQTIYEERRFQDLPVLADALEEEGCDDVRLLDHCRQKGEHALGCWVVDLLLDKK